MCTTNKSRISKPKKEIPSEINDEMADEYFQLDSDRGIRDSNKNVQRSRVLEQCVFVFATLGVITVTHCVTWAQWMIPYIYAIATPIFVTIKATLYWKCKWQFFIIDFCYFALTLTFIFLWMPDNGFLFQTVFALTNGPVLFAAVMYRNSLVFHDHDKMTSCYIHFLPATLTFCIRWYPVSTSTFWFKSFVEEAPCISMIWSYAVPFACFICHSVLYFLIVSVICRPQKPYLTSYSYMVEKFENLNCIGGPWGKGITYYGFSWMFCLASLLVSLLAYYSHPVHCALLAFMFTAILWNGASYYIHVFSKRGFNDVI